MPKGNLAIPIILFGVLLILVLGLVFRQNSFQPTGIKIGLNVELTGELSAVGNSSKNGALLAVQKINEQGQSFQDKRIPLVVETVDGGGDVSQTQEVTTQLINDNSLAMIGPNPSKFAIAASGVAESGHMVMISPWSTNPQTTENKKYVFRMAFLDPFQGEALAKFAFNNLKARKAAILYADDETLKGQADYFENKFKDLGGVSESMSFKSGESDYSDQLTEIEKNYPNVIFLPAYYQDAAKIITEIRKMGIRAQILGTDAWGGQQLLDICGNVECNGIYMSGHFAADSKDPQVVQFVKDYQSAYNQTPDDVAALSFDSINFLSQAISQSKELERPSVLTALDGITEFKGVTGKMKFINGSHDPVKTVFIMKVVNGKLNLFATIDPE